MSTLTWVLLAGAAIVAVVDWWAAESRRGGVETIAKPAVIMLLLGVALTVTTTSELARGFVVAALICSLIGDVALLRSGVAAFFAIGLAAFLVAHLGYVGAMILDVEAAPVGVPLALAATAIVAVGFWQLGRRILAAVRQGSRPELTMPVAAYIVVISLMVTAAWATGRPAAIVGSLAFYASDSLLGWDRFVAPVPHRGLLVMSAYHVGQALLVLSLAG